MQLKKSSPIDFPRSIRIFINLLPRSATARFAAFPSSLPKCVLTLMLHKLTCISQPNLFCQNYLPRFCSDALASCLSSKYSEGLPGDRYYAGNQFIDQIESLCQQRALAAFKLNPIEWAVNVQALSGLFNQKIMYKFELSQAARLIWPSSLACWKRTIKLCIWIFLTEAICHMAFRPRTKRLPPLPSTSPVVLTS